MRGTLGVRDIFTNCRWSVTDVYNTRREREKGFFFVFQLEIASRSWEEDMKSCGSLWSMVLCFSMCVVFQVIERTPRVSPCDPPSPLPRLPTPLLPSKCGVMSTGFGELGSRDGSPRCTESLENASVTSSASASALPPAMANPTVRLIGCAIAVCGQF